jgi:hypothetical protein
MAFEPIGQLAMQGITELLCQLCGYDFTNHGFQKATSGRYLSV